MQLPNIGKPENTLSILIPGTFLLFNILIGIYFLIWVDGNIPFKEIKSFLKEIGLSFSVIVFLIIICLGYLVGAILRLLKCDTTDEWSRFVLKQWLLLRKRNIHKHPYLKEKFPYINHIKRKYDKFNKSKFFSSKTKSYNIISNLFFNSKLSFNQKQSLFNLCKIILISVKIELANECYAAEALNRYLSSMFYAIFISFLIIFLVIIIKLFTFDPKLIITLIIIEILYGFSILTILINYCYIRIKEAETVFGAIFAVKEKLFDEAEEQNGEKANAISI